MVIVNDNKLMNNPWDFFVRTLPYYKNLKPFFKVKCWEHAYKTWNAFKTLFVQKYNVFNWLRTINTSKWQLKLIN